VRQHLAEAERFWFGHHLAGADEADDLGMASRPGRTRKVLRDFRSAIEESDRGILAVGDPEARFAIPNEGNRHTLRWVLAHMTSETGGTPGTRTCCGSSSMASQAAESWSYLAGGVFADFAGA
jgi:hypothetical protein